MATKRKTYTSPAVKDRWNRAHYDRLPIYVQKGGKDEVKSLAELAGLSVSEYVRMAIREKAEKDGNSNILVILRGGGGGFAPPEALLSQAVLILSKRQPQPPNPFSQVVP